MRIIFFGSDRWFSGPVFEALIAAGHQVPVVVTKRAEAVNSILKKKLSGRVSKTLISQEIEPEIKVVDAKTAEEISKKKMVEMVNSFVPDAIVLASFGPPFLAAEVLKWPKYGCFNVHASLLPRWRGASPVFAAIAAGDKQTGVSIMRMTEEVDRGPVLRQASLEIRQPGIIRPGLPPEGQAFSNYDTRESLTIRLGKLGGKLIVDTLKKLETGQIIETPQPEKSPTPYTRKLTKESGRIDWSQSPIEIERFVRAATPWPGAWTEYREEGKRKKEEGNPIKILRTHLKFPLPSSLYPLPYLVIDEVQLPGKNPVSWKQFLAGHQRIEFIPGPKKSKSRA